MTKSYTSPPFLAAVQARVAALDRALKADGGGLRLVAITGGTVIVRFTGLCTGCPLRPLTAAATVTPALHEVVGVEGVEVAGSRISAEAQERIGRALGLSACPVGAGAAA